MKTNNDVSFPEACRIIKQGGVVAIPTETVYGLAGSVFSEPALKKIFYLKKRPSFNPLIVHCFSMKQTNHFHNVHHPLLQKMMTHFSPGPLTFILNKTNFVHPLITAGQTKVGLRIPQHPLTLELIKNTSALCAPSANIFSQLSPTRAEHVYNIFKGKVPVLNGGPCSTGIESTVIEPHFKDKLIKILRPGPVSKNKLLKWLETEKQRGWTVQATSSTLSPGQFKNHYQPAVPLVLIKIQNTPLPTKKEITNLLRDFFPKKTFKQLKLKTSALLSARMLYHEINTLSQNPSHVIYVIKTDKSKNANNWQAIWDRLNKACSRQIQWK